MLNDSNSNLKIIRNFSVKTELENNEEITLKATASLTCRSSSISVVTDSDGTAIGSYEAALQAKDTLDKFAFEFQGSRFDPKQIQTVGFNEQFPESCTAAQYLTKIGIDPNEIEQILDNYELRNVSYLYCAQLPATAARQLWLITALRSSSPILVLRDPFQPFSGRWREIFAELIAKEAIERGRIIICTSVSFMPQCWSKYDCIKATDVGDLAYIAAKKVKGEEEARRKIETKNAKAAQAIQGEPKITINTPNIPSDIKSDKEKTQSLDTIECAYKGQYDFIFQPLADISNFFRRYGLVGGVFGFALVLAIMSSIMVPNIGKLRSTLRSMHFDVSWKDIKAAMPSSPTNDTTQAVQEEARIEQVSETSDEQESPIIEHVVDASSEYVQQEEIKDVHEQEVTIPENIEPIMSDLTLEPDEKRWTSADDEFQCLM